MNCSDNRYCRNLSLARRGQCERGATLVEFGLFFLLFLMVSVGLMKLGRGVWTFTTVAHAARAGARYAITHGKLNPIPKRNDNRGHRQGQYRGAGPADVTVDTTYQKYDEVNGTWQTGAVYNERSNVVEVKVSYPFRLVSGPLVLAQNTIQLSSTSRMIVGN